MKQKETLIWCTAAGHGDRGRNGAVTSATRITGLLDALAGGNPAARALLRNGSRILQIRYVPLLPPA